MYYYGLSFDKIKKKYQTDYKKLSESLMEFDKKITATKNKIQCHMIDSSINSQFSEENISENHETLIREWLEHNTPILDTINPTA